MGTGWKQECEVPGHISSTVRKQREMDAAAKLISPSDSVQDPGRWDGVTHLQCGAALLREALPRHTQRCVSLLILSPFKLSRWTIPGDIMMGWEKAEKSALVLDWTSKNLLNLRVYSLKPVGASNTQ